MSSTQCLQHYGVKGMKWGVRRYQNKDGTLTAAGKKRYYDTPELNAQKAEAKAAKKARNASYKEWSDAHERHSYIPTAKNHEARDAAHTKYLADNARYNHASLKYRTNKEVARIQNKGIEFKHKSKRRLALEEKFKKLGMTDEQAQAAANNRMKVEKVLAASATVAVTVAAAYAANKVLKERVDGIIRAGETLQRIEMRDTGGKLHDAFYVAKGKHDTQRYYNMLGATRQLQTGRAYVMKLMAQKDVKVASRHNASKVFHELMDTDPEFAKSVKRYIDGYSKKEQYDQFNAALVNMRHEGPARTFYDKLKAAGYGAIQDVNDMKFSGYNARNPLIVFDNSDGNIMLKSVKQITEDLHKKGSAEYGKAMGEALAKEYIEKYGSVSVATLTGAAAVARYTDPTKKHKKQGGTSKWR